MLVVHLQGMLQMLPGSACEESNPQLVFCAGPAMLNLHCEERSLPLAAVVIASYLCLAAEDVKHVAWHFERLNSGHGSCLQCRTCLQRQSASDNSRSWGIPATKLGCYAKRAGTVQAAETLCP